MLNGALTKGLEVEQNLMMLLGREQHLLARKVRTIPPRLVRKMSKWKICKIVAQACDTQSEVMYDPTRWRMDDYTTRAGASLEPS